MRKKIVSATFSVAAAAIVGATASAAEAKYGLDVVRSSSGDFLGNGEADSGYDPYNDGKAGAFDMENTRRGVGASTGVFKETVVAPNEENTNLIGRSLEKDGALWLVQSGSAMEFEVGARSAEITLAGDDFIGNGADFCPRFAVLVDGEVVLDDVIEEKERRIELFSGDEERFATVEVIHLSEANNGAVGVSAITVYSDREDPVVPTPEKPLRIEFIGDSITCAYGVEGASQEDNFKTTTENFMKSYAYLAAEKLGAEYSAVCYSGYGVTSGYTSGAKNTGSLLTNCYEYVGEPEAYKEEWDFSAKKNDVVVVNLGTNDSTYIDADFDARSGEFVSDYEAFLRTIREKNPEAYIVCTLGTMGAEKEYPLVREAVDNFKRATGDDRITSYKSATHTAADGFGSDWHPSETTQRRAASVLADKLCRILGLESDGIGLDAACEGEYNMKCSKGAGANAASYYSEFDKSFWVNIVEGGSELDDVYATLSPVELRKDGKYKLSFKCRAPAGTMIPVIVRRAGGAEQYFGGMLECSGGEARFEGEFVCRADEPSAEIVFLLGGRDCATAVVSETRLEKTG